MILKMKELKQFLHPTFLSLKLLFSNIKLFIWCDLYNLIILFCLAWLLQRWLLFSKLSLYCVWLAVAVYRKIMAGGLVEPPRRLNGSVVVLTGGETTIGRALAREMADLGAHLVLASPDLEKAEETKKELEKVKGSVEIRHLDVSSLDSVRKFAQGLIDHKYHLHMLVNAAGEVCGEHTTTVDGAERTLATHHLGHFLLTNLLLPSLTHHMPARVVNVATSAHIASSATGVASLTPEEHQWRRAYCDSQLATMLFTHQLRRRLKGTRVSAFCGNPGLSHLVPAALGWCPSLDLLLQTPLEGAHTLLHCVTEATDADGSYYYSECEPGWPSDAAQDSALAEKFWQESEKLVGLS